MMMESALKRPESLVCLMYLGVGNAAVIEYLDEHMSIIMVEPYTIISQKGSDARWYMTVEELLPDAYRDKGSEYEKGTDTMDVWFDSGSYWAAVLEKRSGLSFPADLYLEGQISIVVGSKVLY
ncbi:hypothetical protein LOK49_LG06G02203 [Camellia lanceoleosa]|uniref:Uncharacterized protein n=1 Tax=Camellia lanceoleosa TaxID=1840588 RepID=A0ACC0HGL6_9ERIC|nr:hypothetical protein LOK49_LG06G02203 [Camellia lanceoleosa]